MSDDAQRDEVEARLKPLWLRGQAGDAAAYAEALSLMARRLRAYFGRRLSALPDDVEDLVQETLLALHLQRGTYDTALPVSAWMFAIARHKLVDLFRRRGRREALHEPLDDLDEGQHPLVDEQEPARRDLLVLLDELPAAQQQAIVLTRIEGIGPVRTRALVEALGSPEAVLEASARLAPPAEPAVFSQSFRSLSAPSEAAGRQTPKTKARKRKAA